MNPHPENNDQESADWLEEWLPLLRCPDTRLALRRATVEECAAHHAAAGLVRSDGSGFFAIDAGIPILLPKDAVQA